MVEIRRARENDIPWLLEQLRAFSAFFGTRRSLFPTDEHAYMLLKAMIDDHVVLIAIDGRACPEIGVGPIVERAGFIGGTISGHPLNPAIRVLHEAFWWVAPEHRGGRAGLALLNEFNRMGDALKADWVVCSLEEKSPVNERALTRRGFRPIERAYLREVG